MFGPQETPATPHSFAHTRQYFPYENDSALAFLSIHLPRHGKPSQDRMEQLLTMLSFHQALLSFEIVATADQVTIQFVCREPEEHFLIAQCKAYFPDCGVVLSYQDMLLSALPYEIPCSLVDFGLKEEFMRPIATMSNPDPYTALFGVFEQLEGNSAIIFQVLFCGVQNPWAESVLTAAADYTGKQSFFIDAPEMLQLAREKVSRPLFGTSIRLLASAETDEEAGALLYYACTSIIQASTGPFNAFIPLLDGDYTGIDRLLDIGYRVSRRTGMLLNSKELSAFVHFPDPAMQSAKLRQSRRTTKSAPAYLDGLPYTLGWNDHQGETLLVGLDIAQRLRHIHIIGATGTGKSTLLHSLIMQDIQNGQGCCVLDPHGDLIDQVLSFIPEERIDDIVYINPAESEYSIGFNILSANSEIEKDLLASDLVSIFRRFSTSWGDQMNSVFANAIMAMVYNTKPFHLGDLRKFLIEPLFRNQVLSTVTDHDLIYYWQKEFPLLKSTSIGPILTRLDTFLRPKVIRSMVCQTKSINLQTLMDSNKIILMKLSQGLMGAENSFVLGALFVSKFQQIAMARQAQASHERKPFFCYIDEFHHFITPSMDSILSGTRKYGLGLVLAHQELQQVSRYDASIASSLLSNPATRICFRLGDDDAKRLEKGFSSFMPEDFQNLGTGEAIARVNTSSADFNLEVIPFEGERTYVTDRVIEHCKEQYGVPRLEEPVQPREPEEIQVASLVQPVTNITCEPTREEVREHRYLQTLIKKLAEGYGYQAAIEVPILNGSGYVDVELLKEGIKIAVEISVTTEPEWELHNVQKCLAAGYEKIVVCSKDEKKRSAIKKRINSSIAPSDQSKISVISPDEIAALLNDQQETAPTTTIMKGYRVKVQYDSTSENKQDVIKRIISGSKKPDM
ncbi:MAG: type IV secretion system DNA-binding domain-containing protein [Bacteroidetes bacterium]|nr:type IV secretion system DNA-binding domain-containing protein [Bacteroidota bacterium]